MKKLIVITLFSFIYLISSAPPNVSNDLSPLNVFQAYKTYQVKLERKRLMDSAAYHESRNCPTIVNSIGCLGLFQFGKSARKITGYGHVDIKHAIRDQKTGKRYLNIAYWPVKDQYLAMDSLMNFNQTKLAKEIDIYVGSRVCGVEITLSGIIMTAHLAGWHGVKNWFDTFGKDNATDMNGTSILTYMKLFSGYKI